jgi:hypothetical protein
MWPCYLKPDTPPNDVIFLLRSIVIEKLIGNTVIVGGNATPSLIGELKVQFAIKAPSSSKISIFIDHVLPLPEFAKEQQGSMNKMSSSNITADEFYAGELFGPGNNNDGK